jgi:hypothetical protein
VLILVTQARIPRETFRRVDAPWPPETLFAIGDVAVIRR